jgi:hypothetical protein
VATAQGQRHLDVGGEDPAPMSSQGCRRPLGYRRFGRRHLERVLRICIQHYCRERPHRGLALQLPEAPPLKVTGQAASQNSGFTLRTWSRRAPRELLRRSIRFQFESLFTYASASGVAASGIPEVGGRSL